MSFICAAFTGFIAYVFYLFPEMFTRKDLYGWCVGYSFLTIGVLMACANVFLFVQIKAKNQALGQETNLFETEQQRLIVILILFDLSYLIRFIWDICFFGLTFEEDLFAWLVTS